MTEPQVQATEAPATEAPPERKGRRGRGERGGRGGDRGQRREREAASEFIEKVVDINRVAKVVKGGRRFSFNALVANMIEGVSKGYRKSLEIQGVGYKAEKTQKGLNLTIGLSHPVAFPAPTGIDFAVDNNTLIRISGPSKELVGQVAAELRSLRPPEPYKGKGIRYYGERVRRKAGKTGAK